MHILVLVWLLHFPSPLFVDLNWQYRITGNAQRRAIGKLNKISKFVIWGHFDILPRFIFLMGRIRDKYKWEITDILTTRNHLKIFYKILMIKNNFNEFLIAHLCWCTKKIEFIKCILLTIRYLLLLKTISKHWTPLIPCSRQVSHISGDSVGNSLARNWVSLAQWCFPDYDWVSSKQLGVLPSKKL